MKNTIKFFLVTIITAILFIWISCAQSSSIDLVKPLADQFKTMQFECEGQNYDIQIPAYVPDLTKFLRRMYSLGDPDSSRLSVLYYCLPYGGPEHYSLIVDTKKNVCPGVLALITLINKELRFWIYYTEIPTEGTVDEYMIFKKNYLERKTI